MYRIGQIIENEVKDELLRRIVNARKMDRVARATRTEQLELPLSDSDEYDFSKLEK